MATLDEVEALQKEITEFRARLRRIGDEGERSALALEEIAVQLMRANFHLDELATATHRVADNQ